MHNITWSATASALGSKELIEKSLRWLTGDAAEISHEKVKSYHGAKMMIIHARVQKKKSAKNSLPYMGSELLEKLADSEQLKLRIDEDNVLHIRLSLPSLVSGCIVISERLEEQVKGRIKLEVYPGQDVLENAKSMLNKAAKFASENDLPSALKDISLG